ncbi:sulfurtransferase [Luteimonas sp. e5]
MVLNIAAYLFVELDDLPVLAQRVRAQCAARGLHGSVLLAAEGINLFLAGGESELRGFLDWLREDPRFAALQAKESWSRHVPFARLKVKLKREIVPFAGRPAGTGDARAPAVAPRTLQRWLETGHDDAGRPVLLLDTRNREEVAHGSFIGARHLPIDNFNNLPEAVAAIRDELADAHVVSFCTGGIRCEKAAPWMRSLGMDNVSQLDGGILRYFEEVGGSGYAGGCFVFDERIALDPQLRPLQDAADAMPGAVA